MRGPSHHSCKESRRSPRSQDLAKQLGLKLVLEGDENYANNTTAAAIGQNYLAYSGSISNKIILPDPTTSDKTGKIANESNKQFCCSPSGNLSVGVGVEIETSALRN